MRASGTSSAAVSDAWEPHCYRLLLCCSPAVAPLQAVLWALHVHSIMIAHIVHSANHVSRARTRESNPQKGESGCTRAGQRVCCITLWRSRGIAPELHGRVCQRLCCCCPLRAVSLSAAHQPLPLVQHAGASCRHKVPVSLAGQLCREKLFTIAPVVLGRQCHVTPPSNVLDLRYGKSG